MSAVTIPTERDLANLRVALERLHSDLLVSMESTGQTTSTAVGTIGETEHLVEEVQREVDSMVTALQRTSLHEVEDALTRFDNGEFGRCVTCGTAIPIERLEAMPAAANCVGCQGARERWG